VNERSPKVSIGIPVYNGADFLADAIESILHQTHADLELIISDNASDDATEDICRKYAAADDRVVYLRREQNVGANPNYNRTFRHARGELFKWAAHDDTLEPTYLERCVEMMDDDPGLVLVHSQTRLIDRYGDPLLMLRAGAVDGDGFVEGLPDPPILYELGGDELVWRRFRAVLRHISFAFPIFGVMRYEALRQTRLMQAFYGTDKVLLGELALVGRFGLVPELLWNRRCHPNTSTRNSDPEQRQRWSDPTSSGSFYPTNMLRGYATALRNAPLEPYERLRCQQELARKTVEPGKWRLMLVPGPWNVLGWGN
jgi:glycosyltransferase involved in cell wall biosynthesis